MKKYIRALNIGQSLKLGFIGMGFLGAMLYVGYLVLWSAGEFVFKMLQKFTSLHPLLEPPFGYMVGVFLIVILAYIAGAILDIKTGGKPLNEKLANIIPGCRFILSVFESFKLGIHSIKNCRFVLIKKKRKDSWEDADFITLGILYDKKQIFHLPEGRVIVRPTVTISFPPNPVTGILTWPHRDCLQLIKTPHNIVIKIILTLGIVRPDVLEADEDQSELDKYYQ